MTSKISKAAAEMGHRGGQSTSEAKQAAARENGKKGGRPSYAPKMHRDGTVTYWSVYQQVWIEQAHTIPDDELAAMSAPTRNQVISHLGL